MICRFEVKVRKKCDIGANLREGGRSSSSSFHIFSFCSPLSSPSLNRDHRSRTFNFCWGRRESRSFHAADPASKNLLCYKFCFPKYLALGQRSLFFCTNILYAPILLTAKDLHWNGHCLNIRKCYHFCYWFCFSWGLLRAIQKFLFSVLLFLLHVPSVVLPGVFLISLRRISSNISDLLL